MTRIELTEKWVCEPCMPADIRESYSAQYHSIHLHVWWSYARTMWMSTAAAGGVPRGRGPGSHSVRQAKREAERVAVEMLEEIAHAVGPFLAQFRMEVEDE